MVGLGKRGEKSPIFCNDSQIAEVDRTLVAPGSLAEYSIYALNENALSIALLFGVYWDLMQYKVARNGLCKKGSLRYRNTVDREYSARYTSEFARRVRQEDVSCIKRP